MECLEDSQGHGSHAFCSRDLSIPQRPHSAILSVGVGGQREDYNINPGKTNIETKDGSDLTPDRTFTVNTFRVYT